MVGDTSSPRSVSHQPRSPPGLLPAPPNLGFHLLTSLISEKSLTNHISQKADALKPETTKRPRDHVTSLPGRTSGLPLQDASYREANDKG